MKTSPQYISTLYCYRLELLFSFSYQSNVRNFSSPGRNLTTTSVITDRICSLIYFSFFFFDYRLNYLTSGLTPMWFHATNVALHAAACVLVTKVSLAVASLRPGFAALTGLLFAAHPIHTEAVSEQLCYKQDMII